MSKEAMKLALEALKQIDEAMPFPIAKLAQAALREALAEQPASYKIRMDLPASISSEAIEADKLLKPQPAQQPTNCRHCGGADNVLCAGQCKVQPAQQKPLTDGQIVASNYPDGEENGPTIAAPDFELICFARQIEAAHGIKENT